MRRKAFTLVELLVVIGIIALLISILLPSLNRARQMAARTACLSNIRQLTIVDQMYINDNKLFLPFCNWGDTQWFANAKVGWLFDPPLVNADPAMVETGSFYPYLKTRGVYRCPTHIKGDDGTFGVAHSDGLTSYLMNGAVNAYGATDANGVLFFRINKFKNDDILFWEADERGGAAWNDGASYPGESFNPNDPGAAGLTARHGRTASIACMDGHAEWIEHKEFYKLAVDGNRNRLWCNPNSGNGH